MLIMLFISLLFIVSCKTWYFLYFYVCCMVDLMENGIVNFVQSITSSLSFLASLSYSLTTTTSNEKKK